MRGEDEGGEERGGEGRRFKKKKKRGEFNKEDGDGWGSGGRGRGVRGWRWHEGWRQWEGRGGEEMKCMLFPGSIINTVINEHRDRGSAAFKKDGNDKV